MRAIFSASLLGTLLLAPSAGAQPQETKILLTRGLYKVVMEAGHVAWVAANRDDLCAILEMSPPGDLFRERAERECLAARQEVIAAEAEERAARDALLRELTSCERDWIAFHTQVFMREMGRKMARDTLERNPNDARSANQFFKNAELYAVEAKRLEDRLNQQRCKLFSTRKGGALKRQPFDYIELHSDSLMP